MKSAFLLLRFAISTVLFGDVRAEPLELQHAQAAEATALAFAKSANLVEEDRRREQEWEAHERAEGNGPTISLAAGASCDVKTGGTCNFMDCDESRGPTYCSKLDDFSCICKPGYCNAGDTAIGAMANAAAYRGKCVRDLSIPKLCDIDQSQKLCGVASACAENEECTGSVYGVCQCKFNYCKVNGACVSQPYTPETIILAANYTLPSADGLKVPLTVQGVNKPTEAYEPATIFLAEKYTPPSADGLAVPLTGHGEPPVPAYKHVKDYNPPLLAFTAVFVSPILCLPCLIKFKGQPLSKLW